MMNIILWGTRDSERPKIIATVEIEYGDIWVGKVSVGQGRDGSSVITDKLYGGRVKVVKNMLQGVDVRDLELNYVILTWYFGW